MRKKEILLKSLATEEIYVMIEISAIFATINSLDCLHRISRYLFTPKTLALFKAMRIALASAFFDEINSSPLTPLAHMIDPSNYKMYSKEALPSDLLNAASKQN